MSVNRSSRELFEETGLSAKDGLQFLGSIDFTLSEKGQPYTMRRYYYHAHFEEVMPESWEHYEMDACDGSDPILFRLFWLPHEIARQRLATAWLNCCTMCRLERRVPELAHKGRSNTLKLEHNFTLH
ncbi:MAG: NUDIX domain-containing protein [Brucellaceae bacterium]|jgi:8-oxo-dGTP pyrophosphatase MutT (NUDIX family)|nr:NUDIX domain-containing protein [Brucellaceae bacterium]